MTNLFDKAMPYRNEPGVQVKIQHKCKQCDKWVDGARWKRHIGRHDHREEKGDG